MILRPHSNEMDGHSRCEQVVFLTFSFNEDSILFLNWNHLFASDPIEIGNTSYVIKSDTVISGRHTEVDLVYYE